MLVNLNFWTGKVVLPEKELLEKATTIKRFEYSPLGKELETQTDSAKKQYQKLDNTYEFDKIIKKEKPTFKKYNRLNLIYNSKSIFYKYYNIKTFNSIYHKTSDCAFVYSNFNEFNNLNPQKEIIKEKKALCNEYVETYFDEYKTISDAQICHH